MIYLIQGWLLGVAYVAPIGMQNMYVINTAIQKSRMRALQVALITIFFDISLALACYYGVGVLLDRIQIIRLVIMGIGSVAVMIIGWLLMSAKPQEEGTIDLDKPIVEVIATCFVVTWLNPQAIIDGTLLLAGFKASLPQSASLFFITGVCIASVCWFLGLSTFVSAFKNIFTARMVQIINRVCGGIIILFGIKLLYLLITEIA